MRNIIPLRFAGNEFYLGKLTLPPPLSGGTLPGLPITQSNGSKLPGYRLPAGTSFSAWFRQHQPALRKNAGHRDWNTIIATQLLPIFEAEPAGWESVTFLNRGPTNGGEPLTERFAQWRAACPDHLRPFVTKLAAVFGVSL